MEIKTNNELNMLKRTRRFILDNAITPPIARVTELSADIDIAITAVEAAATEQVDGSLDASGGVATRLEIARALRNYLKDVARVARSLDRGTHPGLAEQFVLPKNSAYAVLIASANAMIGDATPLQAELIAHGCPATFLADLNALLTAFESGTNVKFDGLQTQVGGTAGLKYRASLGVIAAQKLDAIIRAHFRNDPVTLEVWRHARHIEADPVSEPEGTPPPPGGSASGTTSPGGAGEGGSVA